MIIQQRAECVVVAAAVATTAADLVEVRSIMLLYVYF